MGLYLFIFGVIFLFIFGVIFLFLGAFIAIEYNIGLYVFFAGVLFIIISVKLMENKEYQPRELYECPCHEQDLVVDQIKHYNKSGDTTITTIINLENCVKHE